MKVAYKLTFLIFMGLSSCAIPRASSPEQHRLAHQIIDEGILFLRAGKFDEALSAFTLSMEIEQTAEAIDGLGCVALLNGNYSDAEKLFLRALDYDQTYYHAWGNLGLVYELTGRRSLALKSYQKALAEIPHDFRVRNNFAVSLHDLERGDPNNLASEELRKASLLSNHPILMLNIRKVSHGKSK